MPSYDDSAAQLHFSTKVRNIWRNGKVTATSGYILDRSARPAYSPPLKLTSGLSTKNLYTSSVFLLDSIFCTVAVTLTTKRASQAGWIVCTGFLRNMCLLVYK